MDRPRQFPVRGLYEIVLNCRVITAISVIVKLADGRRHCFACVSSSASDH